MAVTQSTLVRCLWPVLVTSVSFWALAAGPFEGSGRLRGAFRFWALADSDPAHWHWHEPAGTPRRRLIPRPSPRASESPARELAGPGSGEAVSCGPGAGTGLGLTSTASGMMKMKCNLKEPRGQGFGGSKGDHTNKTTEPGRESTRRQISSPTVTALLL